MPVDAATTANLTRIVQDALAEEATRRSEAGDVQLTPSAQEALAMRTLKAGLREIDAGHLSAGGSRLSDEDEDELVSTVLATAVVAESLPVG